MTADRIAGAPISWGVCEVPGWGYQLSPARVLAEMHEVSLAATELGPEGFLPAELTRQAPHRIAHLHIKDVDAGLAREVQSGRKTYTEAVRAGMYRPVGEGDVDFAAIVEHLRREGYAGWYVLEQDTILTEEPHDEGPVADVRTSVAALRSLLVNN